MTVVANASRIDQRVLSSRLSTLADDMANADLDGPALMLYGLAPRAGAALTQSARQEVS